MANTIQLPEEDLCFSCFRPLQGRTICAHCGFDPRQAQEDDWNRMPPGTRLHDRYLVGRVLGQGGFGITYLGFDPRLGTKLAIKEYFPSGMVMRHTETRRVATASSDAREEYRRGMEKFLEEARTLARFEHHPGIVSVKDFFEENGTAYMVMNYFEGTTLLKRLETSGGTLSFEESLAILSPAMDALDEVHADGLIHRDISPDNIFLTQSGQVKILDFGAAKSAMALMAQQSHSIVLKKGYAPPEQYQSRGALGPWTDVYSMAATLYRMLTGQVPPDSLDRLSEEVLIPPSQMGVSLPPEAETALLRALSVPFKERPQSMREFKEELTGQKEVASFAPTAPPLSERGAATVRPRAKGSPSGGGTTPTTSRKSPLPLVAGGVLLLLVAGGGAFFLRGKDEVTPSETVSQSETQAEAPSPARSPLEQETEEAKGGNPKAMYSLAKRYKDGRGVTQNTEMMLEWFQKAAAAGSLDAQNDLGALYAEGVAGVRRDYKEAAKWWEQAAKGGSREAQANLGWLYDEGRGVPKDAKRAFGLYKAAADQGHPGAQANAAYCYESGVGVQRDNKRAVQYYEKAANNGIAEAMVALGACYELGRGVPKNKGKAIYWYQKGADQDNEDAKRGLARVKSSS